MADHVQVDRRLLGADRMSPLGYRAIGESERRTKTMRLAALVLACFAMAACSQSSQADSAPVLGRPSPDASVAPIVVQMPSHPPSHVAKYMTGRPPPDARSPEQQIRDACKPSTAERAAGKTWSCPAINPQTLKYDPKRALQLTIEAAKMEGVSP